MAANEPSTNAENIEKLANAIKRKDTELKSLIEKIEDINEPDKWGDSLLHIAVRTSNKTALEQLLTKNPNLDIKDGYGSSPIHEIIWMGSREFLEILLNAGANVEIKNSDSETVLHKAMKYGRQECATFIINYIENNTKIDLSDFLNQVDRGGNRMLHVAAKHNQSSCAKLAIEKGADVNAQNKYGNTPLYRAAWKGNDRCVDVLVKHEADIEIVNKMKQTALHLASSMGHLNCISLLVNSDKPKVERTINKQDESGNTPLHYSVKGGYFKCIEQLLKAGAKNSIKNEDGKTPIDIVQTLEIADMQKTRLRSLLENGPKGDLHDRDGETFSFLIYALDMKNNFIARGSFGSVFKGKDNKGKEVAIKKIDMTSLCFDKNNKYKTIPGKEIITDIERINHPNVLKVFDYEHDEKRGDLWLAMELCQMTLEDLMLKTEQDSIPWQDRIPVCISIQAIEGLHYLHGKKLAHMDIKENNILLLQVEPWPWVKISDFSLAIDLSKTSKEQVSKVGGAKKRMAPELLGNRAECTQKADIWSLGFVFFLLSLLTKEERKRIRQCKEIWGGLQNQNNTIASILQSKINREPELKHLAELSYSMMAFRSDDRPSAKDVCRQLLEDYKHCYDQVEAWLKDKGFERTMPSSSSERATSVNEPEGANAQFDADVAAQNAMERTNSQNVGETGDSNEHQANEPRLNTDEGANEGGSVPGTALSNISMPSST